MAADGGVRNAAENLGFGHRGVGSRALSFLLLDPVPEQP